MIRVVRMLVHKTLDRLVSVASGLRGRVVAKTSANNRG